MHSFIIRLRNEEGNIMILAFILLIVLTLIGIFATRTAQMDLQVDAYNGVPYRQNFYIAEGGVSSDAAELGTANPSNIKPAGDDTRTTRTLSSTYSYEFLVHQLGTYVAPKGYSAIHFSRYDFSVETWAGGGTSASGEVSVASWLYKIGRKAE